MLCFSQATVSVKISNFVSVVFMSYPIDKENVIENVYIV